MENPQRCCLRSRPQAAAIGTTRGRAHGNVRPDRAAGGARQNVAAESLDDRHAFARLHPVRRFGEQRSLRKYVQYLVDQGKRLLDFAHADPDARVDVALVQHRYLEAQAVVGWIGKRAARVERSAGRAADIAPGGVLPGQCLREHAGIDGAILQRGSVVVKFNQRRKSRADVIPHGLDRFPALAAKIAAHAAGHDEIAHQAMPERRVRRAQHVFAQDAAMGVNKREGSVVADRADVAEVVGQPLELGQQRTQPNGARWNGKLERRLGRARKRVGVGDRAVAGHAPSEFRRPSKIGAAQ